MNIKRQNTILKLVSVIAVFLVMTSCGGSRGKFAGPGVQAYPVLNVHRQSIVLTSSYPTTLKGAQTVEIRPRVQGYITKIPVHEGDVVKKGEVLFQLQKNQYQQDVRSARADVKAAKAAVRTAEDQVKQMKSLVKQNIVSNYKLRSAEDNLQSQKAKLDQAQASLQNALINLNYTTVKSPVNGSIGKIPYRVGSLVSSTIQQPLTTVSDISTIFAYFSMGEQQLLRMSQQAAGKGEHESLQKRVADMPRVHLILPDSAMYSRSGRLQLASGQINTNTASAYLKAIFPNPKHVLLSGSSGEIQIPDSLQSAIVIPKKATFEIQNKQFVYAVTDSNTVKSRLIQTQGLSTPKLYVVKKGLSANAKIVLAGMGQLRDGSKIKPQPVNADSLYQELTVQDQQ